LLSNLLPLVMSDEGYSRNTPCALIMIYDLRFKLPLFILQHTWYANTIHLSGRTLLLAQIFRWPIYTYLYKYHCLISSALSHTEKLLIPFSLEFFFFNFPTFKFGSILIYDTIKRFYYVFKKKCIKKTEEKLYIKQKISLHQFSF